MKTSPVREHFKSSYEFCMGRGFRVESFMSELNKNFHDRTSLILSSLVIRNIINIWAYLSIIDLRGSVFSQCIFCNVIDYVGSTSEILQIPSQFKAVDS